MNISKLILIIIVSFMANINAQNFLPVEIAQGQLDAYNKQDIDAFLSWYSDDVEIYNFPDVLVYSGIENMRVRYTQAWIQNPNQKAEVTDRIHMGNTVIDKEHVIGRVSGVEANVIAIYKIENNKINKVYFIKE